MTKGRREAADHDGTMAHRHVTIRKASLRPSSAYGPFNLEGMILCVNRDSLNSRVKGTARLLMGKGKRLQVWANT